MFDSLDLYIWITCGCLGCAVGIYFGYWLRKRDEADGVVSALKSALDERSIPEAVRQQVLLDSTTTQLLTATHTKLRFGILSGLESPNYKKQVRSIASRLMRIR